VVHEFVITAYRAWGVLVVDLSGPPINMLYIVEAYLVARPLRRLCARLSFRLLANSIGRYSVHPTSGALLVHAVLAKRPRVRITRTKTGHYNVAGIPISALMIALCQSLDQN